MIPLPTAAIEALPRSLILLLSDLYDLAGGADSVTIPMPPQDSSTMRFLQWKLRTLQAAGLISVQTQHRTRTYAITFTGGEGTPATATGLDRILATAAGQHYATVLTPENWRYLARHGAHLGAQFADVAYEKIHQAYLRQDGDGKPFPVSAGCLLSWLAKGIREAKRPTAPSPAVAASPAQSADPYAEYEAHVAAMTQAPNPSRTRKKSPCPATTTN